MIRPFFYCSELSRQAAENHCGTASTSDVWVLLEYTQAWGAKALADSNLSVAVKTHLIAGIRSIPNARLLFIKQGRTAKSHLKLFVVRASERAPFIVEFELESYEQLLKVDLAAAAAGDASRGVIKRGPLFLVCTHGRHDKCCAKFGYALYKSLRAAGHDNVWQSSHVGGDRFAANLVCFPHGLFYGHVTEAAGQMIVGEYAAGRLVLDGYRGRACYSHAVQSAEFFIRCESGLKGLDELRCSERQRVSENSWRVQFAARDGRSIHEAQVTGEQSPFQNYITCHSIEEQSVVQYTLDSYSVALRLD